MVLRALTFAHDAVQVPAQLRGERLSRVFGPAYPLGGIKPGFDLRGEPDLLLSGEQRDLADLLEIGAYRVRRGGEFGVFAGLAQHRGLLLIPEEITGLLDFSQPLRSVLGALPSYWDVVVIQHVQRRCTRFVALK